MPRQVARPVHWSHACISAPCRPLLATLMQLATHIFGPAVVAAVMFTRCFCCRPLHPVHAVEPDAVVFIVTLLLMVNHVLLVNHRRYCWSTWSRPSP